MLNVQYRMHPGISEFPSQTFYESRLQDGISFRDRPRPKGIYWPNSRKPVVFYNVVVSTFFANVLLLQMYLLQGVSQAVKF